VILRTLRHLKIADIENHTLKAHTITLEILILHVITL